MVNKKLYVIVTALIALASFNISKIYVPENFEKPITFRMSAGVMRLLSLGAQIGDKLGVDIEAALLRKFSAFFSTLPAKSPRDNTIISEDRTIDGVKVRIYMPNNKNRNELPLVLHFHGGAYSFGSVDTYDEFIYKLAYKLKYIVISVNYRLAPEHPYPTPVDDCYKVTKYLIENPDEFDFDINKIILIGDSAGGNAVGVVTQRLDKENLNQAKLQILIYPRTQFYSYLFPSNIYYTGKDMLGHLGLTGAKTYLWHAGMTEITKEMENAILSNNHTLLIKDENLRRKYQSYLNIDFIPEEYKKGKSYYDGYKSEKMQYFVYPKKLDENNILVRDKKFAETVQKLLSPDSSPVLADDETVKRMPKAYFAVVEWDAIKDQALVYAGRLRANGVPVDIAFYENGFHGIANYVMEEHGYKVAHQILDGIVEFIQKNI